MSALFASLGLAYSDRLTTPLDWHAAPSADRTLDEARKAGFSRQDEHAAVITRPFAAPSPPALDRLARRFGLEQRERIPGVLRAAGKGFCHAEMRAKEVFVAI